MIFRVSFVSPAYSFVCESGVYHLISFVSPAYIFTSSLFLILYILISNTKFLATDYTLLYIY